MTDKDWLDKVSLAADVYNKDIAKYGSHRQEIDGFVEWLHKLYGIVYEKPNTLNRREIK